MRDVNQLRTKRAQRVNGCSVEIIARNAAGFVGDEKNRVRTVAKVHVRMFSVYFEQLAPLQRTGDGIGACVRDVARRWWMR